MKYDSLKHILHNHLHQATASFGYWILNTNQACYAGDHASFWVPLGGAASVLICLGIPLLTALPVWIYRCEEREDHFVR